MGLKSVVFPRSYSTTGIGPASGVKPSMCEDCMMGDSLPSVEWIDFLPGEGGSVITCRVCIP